MSVKFFDLEFTNAKSAAIYFEMSESQFSRIFKGKCPPTKKMLAKLGYKKVVTVTYEKIPESDRIKEMDIPKLI